MAYSKTTWTNGSGAKLNATNLNKIEQGIADAALADHAHGAITNDGKVGSTAGLPMFTGTAGAVGTKSVTDAKIALGIATFTLVGTELTITIPS